MMMRNKDLVCPVVSDLTLTATGQSEGDKLRMRTGVTETISK